MAEALTQKDVARRLDLDVRQIRNLVKQGLPTTTDDPPRYPWPACLHWYVERKISTAREQFTTTARLDAARLRAEEAKADTLELSLAEKRAGLVPMRFLERQVATLFEIVRSDLTSLPARLAPDLLNVASELEVRQRLEGPIDAALVRLRDAVLRSPVDDDDDLDDDAEDA